MAEGRPCQACRAMLEFHENVESGKLVPAQRVRSVYILIKGRLVKIPFVPPLFISHYETCPDADKFSKKGTQKKDG